MIGALLGQVPVPSAPPPVEPGGLLLEFVLNATGAAVAVVTLVALIGKFAWRLARPHAEELIKKVTETHHHVQPNGGSSAYDLLRDDVRQAVRASNRAAAAADLARRELAQHVRDGEAYVERARRVFAEQGIELPPMRQDDIPI